MRLNFIPENFKLIFSCITGSHLYGTNTPESDTDIRGVLIPSEEYFHGFSYNVEQLRDNVEDIEVYEIRKFLNLASGCNPNIIELLFIPDNKKLSTSKEWEQIEEIRDAFVSKRCRHTFSGYAYSQLNRIKRHREWLLSPPKKQPERGDFGLTDVKFFTKTQIGAFNALLAQYLDEIKYAHELWKDLISLDDKFNYKVLVQNIKKLDQDQVMAITNFPEEICKEYMNEKAYAEAMKHWHAYQTWKQNRNKVRAKDEERFGYDGKHTVHLFRLLFEAKDLLTTGKLEFPCQNIDFLMKVKGGEYIFEEILEMAERINKGLDDLYSVSTVPNQPNLKKIENVCIDIITKHLKEKE